MKPCCEFELDHPTAIYYSGQTISGVIKLTTTTEKKLRNVRIVFFGEGRVKWDVVGRRTSTRYAASELYIKDETFIRGEGVLPAGVHTYTISIALPVQCPTSCEGEYGYIRYGLALILDRPILFDDIYRKSLIVLQTIDLNLNPALKLPLVAEEIGSMCCWSCSSGKVICTLRIPFGAYTPGQTVNYSLAIANQSMVDTDGYSLEFTQKMTFTAQSPRRMQRYGYKVFHEQRSNGTCLRLANRVFEGQFLVPSVPHSSDPSCIIHIQYYLKITVYMSGWHKSLDIAVPIFIGNIPLMESLPSCHAAEPESLSAPQLMPQKRHSNSDMPPVCDNLTPPTQ